MPFDNSKHAARSFAFALDIAIAKKSSLSIISVIRKDEDINWVNDTPSREKNLSENANTILKEGIRKLQSQANAFNVDFDSAIITSKHIGESIIVYARKNNIDLIVMGTRGNAMTKEMMLGRVSTEVALNAHCPVTLMK